MSVRVEVSDPADGVALLRLDAPPRNEGSWVLLEQAEEALASVRYAGARVVVVGSAVPEFFLSHGSLSDIEATFGGGTPSGDGLAWYRVLRELDTGPMISIAAVEGQAWGGGAELCWACDLRVAATSASFAQPEVALGITPGAGGTVRLARQFGEAACLRLVLDGRPVGAQEAHRLGLVHRLVADGAAVEVAVRWARWLSGLPNGATAAAKRAVTGARDLPLAEALKYEGGIYQERAARPEALKLVRAAIERYDGGATPTEALQLAEEQP